MLQTNTVSDTRQLIRNRIRPFTRPSPENQAFSVGWHSEPLTFMQIVDVLKDTITKQLIYFRKVARQDIPDLLQQCWLRLWRALQEDPQLLSERSRLATSYYVSNRCGSSKLRYYLKRYTSYHQFANRSQSDSRVFEDSITEIVIGSSLKSSGRGQHALFARKVDIHLDISRAIQDVATWCGDNIKKLAALYFITTSVKQVDAGRIAGLKILESKSRKPRCVALQYWVKQVLERLQEAFATYQPVESNQNYWRECVNKGELDPVIELAHKYADKADRLLALYNLTTQVSLTTIVDELGVDYQKFKYTTECVRDELRVLYACRRH